MTHAQKPEIAFRRNGRVHLNRRWASVQSNTGSRGVHISGSNAGYTMFRGSVKGTGYPLHSPVSPSLPLVSHHVPSHFKWSLHTTSAEALKTTTHPKTRCRKPYAATQHLMLLMMGVYTQNMSS